VGSALLDPSRTLTDVWQGADGVLATVEDLLRRLLARDADFEEADFRVTIPVETRDGADDAALASKASAWFISLPVTEADPHKRFAAVKA
jgi:hypothetical protein